MAHNLARKHRPAKWQDVIGQDRAVAAILANLEQKQAPPLLLTGASGTGKTTLARLIGATDICEAENAPCGECETCLHIRDGKTVIGFSEINGAKFDTPAHAKQMAEFINEPAVWRWVTFIDEVHGLSKAACDVLLKPIEDPLQDRRIVLATTEPEKVSRTLASRCVRVPVNRLRAPDLFRLLTNVAANEGIRYETKAFDMIATAADGSAREALQLLEGVANHGAVVPARVAEQLSLGTAGLVVRYLRALLAADSTAQDEVLHEWQAEPRDVTKTIRDMLLYIYNMDAAATRILDFVNPAFFEVEEGDRIELAAGFRAHAKRRNCMFADFMLDCLEQWQFDPAIITDRSSLMIRVRRFDRLLNGDDPSPPPVGHVFEASEVVKRKRRRSAAAKESRNASKQGHLSLRQVEAIYTMASFLPQHHGVLLNTKLEIHLPAYNAFARKTPPIVSALTHALALRTNQWSQGNAHWVYVNAREGDGLRTRIALHLPPAALGKVEGWLSQWMENAQEAKAAGRAGISVDAQNPSRAEGYNRNRVQRHWHIFRWLAAGMDPAAFHWPDSDAKGERAAVIDLLKIGTDMRYGLGDLGEVNAIGSSRSLAPASRRRAAEGKMAFLSAFEDCAWSRLQDGWELKEYGDRRQEQVMREEARERVELEFPAGSTTLEKQVHSEEMKKLISGWPEDPRLRARSWPGWW